MVMSLPFGGSHAFSSPSSYLYEPTPEQADAVSTLKTFTDKQIRAWHAFARTSGEEMLSTDQVRALLVLASCQESCVLTWIRDARSRGQ